MSGLKVGFSGLMLDGMHHEFSRRGVFILLPVEEVEVNVGASGGFLLRLTKY